MYYEICWHLHMLAFFSRRISYPLTTNGSVKTYTRTILGQHLVNRAMTMCELPTSNQVLPAANSLDSHASFWRYSTLGSIAELKFCSNKFNLFENMSQQNSYMRHDLGEEICFLLGYYAAYSGNSLPMFCDR